MLDIIDRMEQSEDISRKTRIWFWSVAWLVSGVALIIPYPASALFVWLFPVGMFYGMFPQAPDFGAAYLFGGWLFYGCLTAFALAQTRSARFFIAYAVLCLALVLNVVGCHAMMN